MESLSEKKAIRERREERLYRMFNFKAQVNLIFCIPHIDHGSLLLKSQKNVLAHGWC